MIAYTYEIKSYIDKVLPPEEENAVRTFANENECSIEEALLELEEELGLFDAFYASKEEREIIDLTEEKGATAK